MKKNINASVMKTASVTDVAAARRQPGVDGAVSVPPQYHAVVGLDVGDRQSHYSVLELNGGVVAKGAVKTTEASLRVVFEGRGRMRIALEAGTHSPSPLRGRPGRPLRKPSVVQGDRGYDSQPHRDALERRGIASQLAKRGRPHGSGLGRTRWIVERTLA